MHDFESPAIFFHPDAVETEGKELVGRRSSGQSFLKGFLQHTKGETVRGVTISKGGSELFEKTARGLGETRKIETFQLRGKSDFAETGAIFFPGPGYLDAAWRRQRLGANRCSLIGITHTVSTRRVIEGMHHLMSEPVEPWDAIICTSRAVQSVVRQQMELEEIYFKRRFGATRVPQPQLPLIPLGIHAQDFERSNKARQQMRDRFDAPDNAAVIMTMGRLNTAEKANPTPLYIASELVAQKSKRPVHLWIVGWAARKEEEDLHRKGAALLCPSVSVKFIDGREAIVRRNIWSGADIFTLPVDNIQETFGLVPVEAMAAGLPVVMPDWDGFRDTVIHETTGYLIPTMMQAPGQGNTIANRYADGTDGYLNFLTLVQQQTVIDIPAYVEALLALVSNKSKAKSMGEAGRRHVRANLDWKAIIPQYVELTKELAKIRQSGQPTTLALNRNAISPIEIDPFTLYQSYPTTHPDGETVVSHIDDLTRNVLQELDTVNGRNLYQRRIVPDATILRVSAHVSEIGTSTCAEIAEKMELGLHITTSALLFLAKFNFVKFDLESSK